MSSNVTGKKIAVIGAGVIGIGVAQTSAQSGFLTIVHDTSEDALEKADRSIKDGLRAFNFRMPKEKRIAFEDVKARLVYTENIEDLRDSAIVIENVTENWDLKRDVHKTLDSLIASDSVILVNTSVVPITRLASLYKHPERIAGSHFMNPVPLRGTIEVIRGFHTSDDTMEKTRNFLVALGKKSIVVQDSPGFVSNRVLMLTINEAIFLLHEQVASAKDIDAICRECFGHAMGPLETSDLIGNDTILLSLEMLYESFNDPKFRPSPLLRKMVHAGLLGRKSGRGFHSY